MIVENLLAQLTKQFEYQTKNHETFGGYEDASDFAQGVMYAVKEIQEALNLYSMATGK